MSAAAQFIIEALDPAKHRRDVFDCGVEPLNDYLRTRARREMETGTSACFVLVPQSAPERIAGFYTLSAATIRRSELSEGLLKKLPRYPEFPATLLGRLARSLEFKGQGTGNRLMVSAFSRAVEGARQVASWAVVTDPKDNEARRFYESFGFRALTQDRLFIPMKEAAELLTAR
ncbi:MAG TPA: GNAT family N-acetyltransferase [Candidatus Binatia bacterium]|jgi:predicted GNAT family N-acyltransferase|nr:GNAT family N-acetyltransferase [Candidatus Binatia bacterium]